ncbi:UNVERIFIED_CONTAM: hypothetical protein RMT77_000085 [Armadillidium vulgare]
MKLLIMVVVISSSTTPVLIGVNASIMGIPDFLELGSCVEVGLVKNFTPQKFDGLWFDIMRVPNEYQEGTRCLSQIYSWTGTEIEVRSYALTEDNERTYQEATMTPKENKAFMNVVSEGVPNAPYKVMWTDYSSTACVYSCLQYSFMRAEFAWVISRFKNPHEKTVQRCLNLFKTEGIDTDKLVRVQQGDDCEYLVDIEKRYNETQLKIDISTTSKYISSDQNKETTTSTLISKERTLISETEKLVLGKGHKNSFQKPEEELVKATTEGMPHNEVTTSNCLGNHDYTLHHFVILVFMFIKFVANIT